MTLLSLTEIANPDSNMPLHNFPCFITALERSTRLQPMGPSPDRQTPYLDFGRVDYTLARSE